MTRGKVCDRQTIDGAVSRISTMFLLIIWMFQDAISNSIKKLLESMVTLIQFGGRSTYPYTSSVKRYCTADQATTGLALPLSLVWHCLPYLQ